MSALRRHGARWALLLILAFVFGAAEASASACMEALSDAGVSAGTSCTGCGGSDDPDQDGWSCAVPCSVSFIPGIRTPAIYTPAPTPHPGLLLYSYVGWAAPPLVPPPRST